MLAGYLECGLEFLMDLDYVTRGSKIPFVQGLDANTKPEAWLEIMWGAKNFLEHREAEVVTARNSNITCVGAANEEGGTNIDYYIMSTSLLGCIENCLADFDCPFSPHFGLALTISADPKQVMTQAPSGNKIQKQQLRLAKGEEICLRKKNDEQLWQDTFETTESTAVDFDESEMTQQIKQHFEEMTDSKAANCLLSCNFGKWAKTVQQLVQQLRGRRGNKYKRAWQNP